MSFIKKPFLKLKDHLPGNNSNNSSTNNIAGKDLPSKEEGLNGVLRSPSGSGTASPIRSPHNNTSSPRGSRDLSRKSIDKKELKLEHRKHESRGRFEEVKFLQDGPEEVTKLYKPLSMNQSRHSKHEDRALFKNLNWAESDGKTITFRARMHTLRRMSAKLVFIVFRQQTHTIQGVLQSSKPNQEKDESEPTYNITENMVRTVEHYPPETIVLVIARVRKALQHVKNATVHEYELDVLELHRVGSLTQHLPFSVYDAENINRDTDDPEDDDVGDDESTVGSNPMSPTSPVSATPNGTTPKLGTPRGYTDLGRMSVDKLGSRSSLDGRAPRSLPQRVRLNNRIVDLRTAPAQSIFRIQSGICNLFRKYLDGKGFLEIHTPKLQGGATESGATVFQVDYFGRPAFLAQSPQLAKQMCIAADFERIYEIGPVFRAEDSNTPRHLTEYTGLDLEMALEEHYHEALNIIDGMFKTLWNGIYERYQKEIDIISQYYPHSKVEWLQETPRIPFKDGIKMLVESGWVEEDGSPPSELEDLSTRAEIRLGALVKEKYHTDYYILDKFPASVRPFYTMPDPTDDRYTNSFDIFMRGQEILTGGQRVHDADFLEKRMKAKGVKPESMMEYIEGFRWGAPPHAGCGIGLERLTYLFLSLGNIRLASLFHRDPKSLPAVEPAYHPRHEEASTTNPPWENKDIDPNSEVANSLQPLEKLIANYGDAANTSWLDERYHVWRHAGTGAAQGYVVYNSHAIIVGDPLCAKWQYSQVISAFLDFLKTERKGVHPIWMIASPRVEEILGEKYVWRTLACIAEERADPRNNPALKDGDLARKVRHAEKEGVKNTLIPFNSPVPADFKAKVDALVKDWQNNRKGTQVHLTEIRPWVDETHRRYFYASSFAPTPNSPSTTDMASDISFQSPKTSTSEETIRAVCILHQLSPHNGYQIKFSLEFPGAPSGTIESLILWSLKHIAASDTGTKSVTFGTGAMHTLEGGRNLGKTKVKALKKAYEAINRNLKLTNKSEFRDKMGCINDPVYVAYPRGGLGAGGIRAIMGFLEDEG